jgi:hypothetical protein
MAVMSVNDIAIGDNIRFKSISTHDNVYWVGTVTGICNYDNARRFSDVDTYYAEVARTTELPAKEKLTYILLNVTETNGIVTRCFAKEWIDQSTLEKVATNTYALIKIYDINDSKLKDVINYIRALDYAVEKVDES